MIFKSRELYYIVRYNYYKLNLFLVLIEKFDQNSNFSRTYKSRIGPKEEENKVFKSCEWNYIVSTYNYY